MIFSDNCLNFVYTEPSDNLMDMVSDNDDWVPDPQRSESPPEQIPTFPDMEYSENEDQGDPGPSIHLTEIQSEIIDQPLNPPAFFGVRTASKEIMDRALGSSSYCDHRIEDTSFRDFLAQDDIPNVNSLPVLLPKQRVFLSARDAVMGDGSRASFANVLARDTITGPEMQIQLSDLLSARGTLLRAPSLSDIVNELRRPLTPIMSGIAYEPEPSVSFNFNIGDRVVSKNERCDGMHPGVITAKAVKDNLPTYTVLFLDDESDVGVAEEHMFKMSEGLGAIIPSFGIMLPLLQRNNKRVAQKSFVYK